MYIGIQIIIARLQSTIHYVVIGFQKICSTNRMLLLTDRYSIINQQQRSHNFRPRRGKPPKGGIRRHIGTNLQQAAEDLSETKEATKSVCFIILKRGKGLETIT